VEIDFILFDDAILMGDMGVCALLADVVLLRPIASALGKGFDLILVLEPFFTFCEGSGPMALATRLGSFGVNFFDH